MTRKKPSHKELLASQSAHIKKILSRLKRYEKMNFLERYAMFMGKAQFIELYLRQALINDRGYDPEKIERTPLGGVIRHLKEENANKLIIFLAEDVNDFRRPLAHEFLVNTTIMADLLGGKMRGYTKPLRILDKALFSVEQFLHNFESLPKGYIWRNDGKTIEL